MRLISYIFFIASAFFLACVGSWALIFVAGAEGTITALVFWALSCLFVFLGWAIDRSI